MENKLRYLTTIGGLGLLLLVQVANATVVQCPPATDTTAERFFTLDTSPVATCFDYGPGNLEGNGSDEINVQGYITLDKSDDATTGAAPGSLTVTPPTSGTSGSFSFTAVAGYTDYIFALKTGNNLDPSWAAFSLPDGVTSGTWTISSNELSHANLYAKAAVVPIPAAVWLFGSAMVGMAGIGYRRRDRKALVL